MKIKSKKVKYEFNVIYDEENDLQCQKSKGHS